MYAFFYRLAAWLVRKLVLCALITAGGLAAYGLWLFVDDPADVDGHHTGRLGVLRVQRDEARAVRDRLSADVAALGAEIAVQEDRALRAGKVVATLTELESTWESLVGNRAQQQANAEQKRRMEVLQAEAKEKRGERGRALNASLVRLEKAERGVADAERELKAEEDESSPVWRYGREAWSRCRWYVAAGCAAVVAGPLLWALFLYYGVAPSVGRGRAITLGAPAEALPEVVPGQRTLETSLWQGERLLVKASLLQAAEAGLSRRTRLLFKWAFPFTSLACGLVRLAELRHDRAGGEQGVSLDAGEGRELVLVDVPEEASLVVRPRFLAGVITGADRPLVLKPRWQVWRWQAWVSLQFRFFECAGPCRLILVTERGGRAETLDAVEGERRPVRRLGAETLIGFTPGVDYQPVRAVSFRRYHFGRARLFDELVSGPGLLLVQDTVNGRESWTRRVGKLAGW